MTALAATLPPWTLLAVATLVALVASRRAGALVAVVAAAVTVPWALTAPAGAGLTGAPLGFAQTLVRVDGVTRPVAAVFAGLAGVAVAYAYATDADRRTVAYALWYVTASLAAVFAGDWLTLLIAWELMAVAATVLVWHHGGAAVRPAFRYAVYHLVGGSALIAGVVLHYEATGTFATTTAFTPGLPTALAVLGVGVNLGFLGLHYWVPDTYPRPHVAVSLVLAGYTTKVAVYALLRLLPDGATLVAFVGAATVVYAVWMAILQTDLRRLLSYHIVSQVGYMVTAVGVGTAAGTAGAVAHLTTHVVYKALLFAVAGALVYRTGTESLDRLGGLARRTPVTFAAFLVAALAIAGVPGFSGFVSKGLVVASVEGVAGDVLWWALVVGGVGTALSFAKVGYYVFVRPAPEPVPVRPAPRLLTATLVVLAVPSVAFGLAPGLLFGLVPGGAAGFQPYATSELTKATLVAGAGVAAFLLVRRRLGDLPDTDVDRLLHPVAFRLANDTARGLLAVGRRADDAVVTGVAAAGAALTPRRDTGPPGGRLGVALLVVAAALGLALLVAGVG